MLYLLRAPGAGNTEGKEMSKHGEPSQYVLLLVNHRTATITNLGVGEVLAELQESASDDESLVGWGSFLAPLIGKPVTWEATNDSRFGPDEEPETRLMGHITGYDEGYYLILESVIF
jgi:hypothetical protein